MKKVVVVLMTVAAICTLTACGGNGKETEGADTVQEQSAETENNETIEDETEQVTEVEPTESETEEVTESVEAVEPAEPEEFTPVAGLSGNYADLEKRCFAYNGQIFTLGESTLQDLIDGGVPFSEDALNNVGNNVNSNYETDKYDLEINDYVNMQFSFINTTESNITEAECLLSNVRWYSIYVPQPDYDESMNEEIVSLISDASKYVCFSFPLTLTKEQLLENNGDATEIDEYNNVKYMMTSEVYMGESGYNFDFNKNTNQLEDVSISWLP